MGLDVEGATEIRVDAAASRQQRILQQLRRAALSSWPVIRRVVRGRALGVVFTLLFCAGVLAASVRASDQYYERHLVAADNSYALMNPAVIVSGKQELTLGRLARHPALLGSSDGDTDVYVLHHFSAWFLRSVLPLRPAMAVLLNGVWFAAMALSVYSLFWSRIGRWSTATLATVAYLIANPFLTSVTYGITSADPNIVGFMLGTSALCCVILSDHFQRTLPCLFAGLFLGALALGRVYTLGVVLPAIVPYVLACFWRRSRDQMLQSLSGGLFALAVMCLTCGWWLKSSWRTILAYPTQFGSQGVLSKTELTDSLLEWAHFPKIVFSTHLFLICVLTWPFAAGLLGEKRRFRTFNWPALWAALVPFLVLAKLGTNFQPYGAVALLGAFALLLFPFASNGEETFIRHRGFAAALAFACALGVWSFFGELQTAHAGTGNNKRGTVAALTQLRDHAARAGRKRVTLALVHSGALHDASLVDALIFDAGVRVGAPHLKPKRRRGAPLVVDPLVVDPWAWVPMKGAKVPVITPELWAQRVSNEADYVLVLAGGRNQNRRQGRWPPWVEASELLRASPLFRPLGSVFNVPGDGPVELLVRREFRPD